MYIAFFRSFVIGLFLFLFASFISAQEIEIEKFTSHEFIFKTQYIQLKDDVNYGLVFSGVNLMAGYSYSKKVNKMEFAFESELGFGATNNIGTGFAWRFKPVNIFYGKESNHSPLTIGGYFACDYQWQQYSELKGGQLYWFNTIEVGPKLIYSVPYKSNIFKITVANSIVGLLSRPEPSTETYYYSFDLAEFAATAHKNIEIGFSKKFNRTSLEVELDRPGKRFSFAYQFECFEYYQSPKVKFLNHSLNLKWKLGKL